MNIVSWNINGIRAWVKKSESLNFAKRADIDFLCLNETRIDESLIPSLQVHFPEYPYQYWSCSAKKGYAGVAILSKHLPLSIDPNSSSFTNHAGRVLTLEFSSFYLISTYFPNSGSTDQFIQEKRSFDDNFRDYLSSLISTGKELILLGDFNIVQGPLDYFQPKNKPIKISEIELESFQLFLKLGLIDSFRHLNPSLKKFTWFNNRFPQHRLNNRGWRIDYAFVTSNALPWVENSIIHSDVLGSDHTPIELVLNISP